MFDHTTAGQVERNGTASVGTSTAGPAMPSPGQTAPARSPLELLQDTATRTRGLADLDWSSLSASDLDRALRVQRRLEGAVAAVRSRLVSAAAAGVVDAAGATDVTNLVRDRLGLSGRDARRQATLADGLDGLDATRAELADGRIGADAARLVTEAVADGRLGPADEVEPLLLERARVLDPDRLARWIRRKQAEAAPDKLEDQEARAIRNRSVWSRWRKDGTLEIGGRLPALTGAMWETAIGAYATVDQADTPEEMKRSFGQRQADALKDLLGEALSAPAAGRPGRVRPHVLVVGTASTFADGVGVADLDGQPISAELARRIACDAGMSRLLVNAASMPLDLGREVRNWTAGQRRAIVARDGHCRGPSCDRPAAWCDIHHISWWSEGGGTDLDNGVLLCSRHHDLVHHGGWTVVLDPASGRVTWTSRLGTVVETEPAGVLGMLAEAEAKAARARSSGPPAAFGPGSSGALTASLASEARARYLVGRSTAAGGRLTLADGRAGRSGPAETSPARSASASGRAPGRHLVGITGCRGRAP